MRHMADLRAIAEAMGGEVRGTRACFPTPGHSPRDRGSWAEMVPSAPGGVLISSGNGANPLSIKELRTKGVLPARGCQTDDKWRVTGTYEFAGTDGGVLYRIRRQEAGNRKRFTAERPDGRGGWQRGLGEVARVLYRLPELLSASLAEPVYFAEGERKADKLACWGFVATAIAFGANGWRDTYAEQLANRRVIILPDNDQPGRAFAEKVRASLCRAGARPVVLELPGLPPKGDVIDWSEMGGSADELRRITEAAINPPARRLATVNPAEWHDRDAPPREWALQDWIPLRQATLLTGKGGVGKSLLAQQLATCIAVGIPFLGLETRRANALYLSCEDDREELWRRQRAICATLGITLRDLDGKLLLAPMAGEIANHLATFDQAGKMMPSERWREIEATVAAASIGFFALDNASHLMVGDHNELSSVASFLNLLNGLAIACNGTGLILHHPNKAGDDWLGSVAWENQVRSRLIMKPSDQEGDWDARSLQNPKANYAPMGGRIDFRWHRGAFVTAEELPANAADEIASGSRAAGDNAIFLTCLAERTRRVRAVSEKRSASYAPTVFVKMSESKGASKARLEAAMDRLFRLNRIERAELWTGPDRKPVVGLREIAGEGLRRTQEMPDMGAGDTARGTVRATRDTVLETADLHAGDAVNTHTTPKGGLAAALPGATPHQKGQSGPASPLNQRRGLLPSDEDCDPAAEAYLRGAR